MRWLLLVVSVVAVAAIGLVLHAYTLAMLWLWFVVPLGAPVLGMVPALGVQLTVNALLYRPQPKADPEKPRLFEKVAGVVVAPVVFLGVGWLVKGFL